MSITSPFRTAKLARGLLGLVASSSLLAVGCAAAEHDPLEGPEVSASTQALKERYDGETLVRGIFFGRGPVAKALPEIWEKAPLTQDEASEAFLRSTKELERSPELEKADQLVLETIKKRASKKAETADEVAKLAVALLNKQDPKFLAFFEKSIYSGNPVIVSDAVAEAGRRINELVEIEMIRDPGRYGTDFVINDNIAINTNLVLNVNVAINVDTVYNLVQFWSLELDRESILRNEVMVAKITSRFAG